MSEQKIEAKEFIELAVMAQRLWDQYGYDGLETARQVVEEHEQELKKLLASYEIIATPNQET